MSKFVEFEDHLINVDSIVSVGPLMGRTREKTVEYYFEVSLTNDDAYGFRHCDVNKENALKVRAKLVADLMGVNYE